MPAVSLTRRVTFAAAHRYRRPEWSDEQNERAFGLCARHSYHGHSYSGHGCADIERYSHGMAGQ